MQSRQFSRVLRTCNPNKSLYLITDWLLVLIRCLIRNITVLIIWTDYLQIHICHGDVCWVKIIKLCFSRTISLWHLWTIYKGFLISKYSFDYIPDCHNFIPFLQLCVCLDKSGMHKEAFEFYRKARTLKPNILLLFKIRSIFMRFWGFEKKCHRPY